MTKKTHLNNSFICGDDEESMLLQLPDINPALGHLAAHLFMGDTWPDNSYVYLFLEIAAEELIVQMVNRLGYDTLRNFNHMKSDDALS
ncbi:hypothetical protein BDQ17DRAFT_1434456 [Cyathus striatus]|nr:hypothetical protein BDQ17DRAFT_1434456 [Cyathus striatus]